MTTTAISSHRPKDASATAIRNALDGLKTERATLAQQIEDDTARRTALLIDGTDKEIAAAESAIREARLNIERIDAVAPDLERQLVDAVAQEAGAEREAEVHAAAEATARFNAWFQSEYSKAAAAIAAGLELEREAIVLRERLRNPDTRVMPAGLPELTRAFVGQERRSLGFLVRLPATEVCAEPFAWPR